MSIASQLPVEILEKILDHLDGKSFLRAKQVCKHWKLVCEYVVVRFSNEKWQQLCLETIPTNCLIEYLQCSHPPKLQMHLPDYVKPPDLDWVNWRTIFINHQVLNDGQSWTRCIETVIDTNAEDDDPVTVTKVCGDFLITGHFSGLICLWTQEKGFDFIDFIGNVFSNPVSDIVTGDVYHNGPYRLSSEKEGDLKMFSRDHFLVAACQKGKVCARGLGLSFMCPKTGEVKGLSESIFLEEHNERWISLSLMGNSLATFSRDNTISLWDVVVPDHFEKTPWKLPRLIHRQTFCGPNTFLLFGNLWPNKMAFWLQKFVVMTRYGFPETMHESQSWKPSSLSRKGMTLVRPRQSDDDGKNLVIIGSGNHLRSKRITMQRLPEDDLFACLGRVPEKYQYSLDLVASTLWSRLFHDNVFAILTTNRLLLLSIDGNFYRRCQVTTRKREKITAVMYYANVLVLGFSAGTILVYFTVDPIDLMTLDYDRPDQCLGVANEPIVHVDIGPGVTEGLVNVAVTCAEGVHLLHLHNY